MRRFKSHKTLSLFTALILLCGISYASSDFYTAKVKDISDRAYEPAVIELLDSAKKSIVMSMYILSPDETGPVRLLVKDLEEALERGVKVEIYLNTKVDDRGDAPDTSAGVLGLLAEKGARIYKITSSRRLHDKLIIVDERYVVDGSMNWSASALRNNYESALLVDSPELAKAKLIRMRQFALVGEDPEDNERPDRPKGLKPLPEGLIVGVNKELLNNKAYFAAMLKGQADRAIDTHLLLLGESARIGKNEFFIPLEDLAVALGMSPEWSDTALRRQSIKVLKALRNRYKLIDADFSHGKDAWVTLKDLPGGVFTIKGEFFAPANLELRSQPAKFVFLMKALLEAEGASIDSFSAKDLSKRFGVSQDSIYKGLAEIKEK